MVVDARWSPHEVRRLVIERFLPVLYTCFVLSYEVTTVTTPHLMIDAFRLSYMLILQPAATTMGCCVPEPCF